MADRLEDQIRQLYEPLGRRHDALREDLLAALPQPAAGGLSSRSKWRDPMRIAKYAGVSGLAAAALVVVGVIVVMNHTTPKLSAAEALEAATQASSHYDGWIHVRFTPEEPNDLRLGKGEMHLNLVDDTVAMDYLADGIRELKYCSLKKNEFLRYRAKDRTITTDVSNREQAAQLSEIVRMQTTPAGLVREIRQYGKMEANVTQGREGAYDRFDLTLPKAQENCPWTRLVVLVDPKSKLVQQMTMMNGDKRVGLLQYTYGDPKIESIYDLGVPRDAEIVEAPPPATAPATQAAEGEPPPKPVEVLHREAEAFSFALREVREMPVRGSDYLGLVAETRLLLSASKEKAKGNPQAILIDRDQARGIIDLLAEQGWLEARPLHRPAEKETYWWLEFGGAKWTQNHVRLGDPSAVRLLKAIRGVVGKDAAAAIDEVVRSAATRPAAPPASQAGDGAARP
jgi:hypothetical protein